VATIDEIAQDTFRISTFIPGLGITFNQFVVRDDEPLLFHTGFRSLLPETRDAVARILDPATIRWIGFSHFEPDECGALNEWLAVAPQATPIASFVGVNAMLNDYSDRPAHVMSDGEEFATGTRRFQFLSTPHLPHGWDASLLFEKTERTLFCSDLFLNPGETPPIVEHDMIGQLRELIAASLSGPFAHDLPYTAHTQSMLARLAALEPATLATMHGAAWRGDGEKALSDYANVLRDVLGAQPIL
jgi:flavorubredoxin